MRQKAALLTCLCQTSLIDALICDGDEITATIKASLAEHATKLEESQLIRSKC